ncbi:hypothetical protein CATMIT_01904, partial [Catenibacterium mitsuokai DSM 15897]
PVAVQAQLQRNARGHLARGVAELEDGLLAHACWTRWRCRHTARDECAAAAGFTGEMPRP